MGFKVLIPQPIGDIGAKYLLDKGYEVFDGTGIDEAALIRDIVDCDAVTSRTAPYTKKVIDAAKRLKVIANMGVGVDNIDVAYATEKGIWVTNNPYVNAVSVAEHTMFLILSCAKNAHIINSGIRRGNYNIRDEVTGIDIENKVLGIIGLGNIGRNVARMAIKGFNIKVIGYDPYTNRETLMPEIEMVDSRDEIFVRSDFVSLHTPVTPESKRSIGMREFKLMKKTAYLINACRGELVMEQELIDALKSGVIKGAGTDVTAVEPTSMDNELLHLENVVFTPHHAALTEEAIARMSIGTAKNIEAVLCGGIPLNPVNKPVFSK